MSVRQLLPLLFLINIGYTVESLDPYRYFRSELNFPLNDQFTELPSNLDSQYDFIIIGSGSAGSVIANRLSEISDWNILLLEAGHRPGFTNYIPVVVPLYQVAGDYNWKYTTEKQEGMCLAMEGQICAWPRGKALGGSTVLNYMIYTRGHPQEYDMWGKDNPGWSYKEVLPYFIKSEHCNLGKICNSKYHGTGGYLSISEPYNSELTDHFIAAGQKLGYDQVDYNSNNLIGFSKIQATQKFGRRHSTATAFLDPVLTRSNLKIVETAKVTKILVDPKSKIAYGVQFVKNGQTISVKARKEVILSAGVLNSPQLLMLSGIGPKDHLTELGISPIIEDLPVGKKLYDHVTFPGMLYSINKMIEPFGKLLDPISASDWLLRGEGIWKSLGGMEAIAFVSTKNQTKPDLELILSGMGFVNFDRGVFSRPGTRITKTFYNEYYKPLEDRGTFMIAPILLHPKSFGSLKLRSKDPNDLPLCYGNYFTDSNREDMNLVIKSIRFIQKLVDYKGFDDLNATLYDKPVPGCEHFEFDTDGYWECTIRHLGITLHHQITTCKMGSGTDSVVDNRLRVHGVKNLRVADTSVIPLTLSAHTSAPAMMVGEKAADIIKEDHGRKNLNKR